MGRMYKVPITGTIAAASGDHDLCLLLPADDIPIRLRGFTLGQTTEVGDTPEEGVRVTIRHLAATVTNGTGGSAPTPVPSPEVGGTAAGFTCRILDTAVATSSGTNTIVEEIGWINRNTPLMFGWDDEKLMPQAKQGAALVLRLETTLADDMTFVGTAYVEELTG